jgi:UDP-3-O-[3-hydroxymyristoyl] N-acetylglucosamine deacetylase
LSIVGQKTLKNRIGCTGIGLHSGEKVRMTLLPAAPDSGVVFRRVDLAGGGGTVAANIANVSQSALCTTLRGPDGVQVGTVEHLMAALAGCAVDNVVVEIDGPEVPIMDGSAAPFVFLVECAGVVEQAAQRQAIRILERVEVREGEKWAALVPADTFAVSFEIDYASPAVSRQDCFFTLTNGTFKDEISRARTFGFMHEVEELRALGLARGGSLDNAVVVNGDSVLNEGGLRFDDEFVRHKVLDSVGDLYLLGAPLIGHFHGVRSGHALNHRLLRALLDDESAWCYTAQSSGAAMSPDGDWPESVAAFG